MTCPWPPEYSDLLAWQWEKKVIPYWTKHAEFAAGEATTAFLGKHIFPAPAASDRHWQLAAQLLWRDSARRYPAPLRGWRNSNPAPTPVKLAVGEAEDAVHQQQGRRVGGSDMAGSELPAVIVNISRSGPGLGGIAPSQGDYFQAVKCGGHGGLDAFAGFLAGITAMTAVLEFTHIDYTWHTLIGCLVTIAVANIVRAVRPTVPR